MVIANAASDWTAGAEFSYVDLGDSARVALMIVPEGRGSFSEQLQEVLSQLLHVLEKQPQPMVVTVQTVFLRDAADEPECERVLSDFYGAKHPVTNVVLQPPCCGAALALEAWVIGGKSVRVEHYGPQTLAVSYDSVRWIYCAGVKPERASRGVYRQTMDGLVRMRTGLAEAGSSFEHVVRTWLYLGAITNPEADRQRYQELNRARTDFYHDIRFRCSLLDPNAPRGVYPASTGIGTAGDGLVMSCLALETRRDDVLLLPLENPQQTPAYAYHPKYSPQSPKFSRAVALVLGDYVTTWISGTASIVNSETCHQGDLEKQTHQTIDNIERLIAPDNFALHGVQGAGARLHDLAKIRVYLKRPGDLAICKSICERRFGSVPAVYAVADVCRPDLLVEIEGVAFSRFSRGPSPQR
jgi:enamine deaminase RidA (YjgF/YER057c/UK114 family)